MTVRGLVRSSAALAVGCAVAAALFWALINVPESNVLMLTLSGILALGVFATLGLTIGGAASPQEQLAGIGLDISRDDCWDAGFAEIERLIEMAEAIGAVPGTTTRRAVAALPRFAAGLVVFALLWWITDGAERWWTLHRGEVDAVFIRYGNITSTRRLHETVFWMIWLVRWGLGCSVVAALVAAGSDGWRAWVRGLRASIRLAPLVTASMAAVVLSEAVWRIVYWMPKSLPVSWIEFVFAGLKLIVLYALVIGIAAFVIGVCGRASRETLVS